jgi:hypothetical protein
VILIKAVIAGSRGFNDYEYLKEVVSTALQNYSVDQIEIVSGCAEGADKLGERLSEEWGCKLTKFPADWVRYGNSAGHLRNIDMSCYGDVIFCFWDGVSNGTRGMIRASRKAGKIVHVIKYKEERNLL